MKRHLMLLALVVLSGCMSAPNRPVSLWDDLPSTDGEGAKSVPSKIWEPETPNDMSEEGGASVPEFVPGVVVINEIFYDSAESDTDGHLFVELHGTPGMTLAGFKVSFVNGSDGGLYDTITIPAEVAMPEDGFYVIADAKTGDAAASNVEDADLIDNFDPQNGPDALQLLDASGALLDAVGYGEEVQPVAENGMASFEGTPAVDGVGGQSLERREPGLDTGDNAQDFFVLDDPTPGFQHTVSPETNPTAEPEPIPLEDAPNVVLNEIYYDAVGGDSDGVLFIELYGDPSLVLEGYQVALIDGADGSVDDTILLPQGSRLGADGFFVIGDSKTGFPNETLVPGADFIDNFDPANGPDAVHLLDAQGTLLDAIGYAEGGLGFEGEAAPDVLEGHSLERSLPGLDSGNNATDFTDRELPTPGTGFPM